MAFDSSPSWGVRAVAALVFFAIALPGAPGAGREKPLAWQVTLAAGAQVVIGYWFVRADDAVSVPAHAVWPSSVHASWPVAIAHVVLTAWSAVLLHGMDTCRRRVLRAAGRELLRRLFAPVCTPLELAASTDPERCPRYGEDRTSPAVDLLADAVVRRGPPFFSLLLAA
ncbi:hypothetical protein [Streptomyces sp. Tue6028]|uniref:hypothetical protein n=1 Tax=Streptomyces sp. Tue6028 TaxID=2036037 RepID=UPI00117BE643|nr:hypothetical protein [Streptomyces sp. Tue6028]